MQTLLITIHYISNNPQNIFQNLIIAADLLVETQGVGVQKEMLGAMEYCMANSCYLVLLQSGMRQLECIDKSASVKATLNWI